MLESNETKWLQILSQINGKHYLDAHSDKQMKYKIINYHITLVSFWISTERTMPKRGNHLSAIVYCKNYTPKKKKYARYANRAIFLRSDILRSTALIEQPTTVYFESLLEHTKSIYIVKWIFERNTLEWLVAWSLSVTTDPTMFNVYTHLSLRCDW